MTLRQRCRGWAALAAFAWPPSEPCIVIGPNHALCTCTWHRLPERSNRACKSCSLTLRSLCRGLAEKGGGGLGGRGGDWGRVASHRRRSASLEGRKPWQEFGWLQGAHIPCTPPACGSERLQEESGWPEHGQGSWCSEASTHRAMLLKGAQLHELLRCPASLAHCPWWQIQDSAWRLQAQPQEGIYTQFIWHWGMQYPS